MPESPEVRHFTDQVNQIVAGHTIKSIEILGGRFAKKGLPGLDEFREKMTRTDFYVLSAACKGKFQFWRLSPKLAGCVPVMDLWVTFGMSGSWRLAPEKHAAVSITLSNSANDLISLFYVDPRHFGTIHIVDASETAKKLNSLGPDPFYSTSEELASAIKKKTRLQKTIAEVLMDQRTIAGVGNYIKAEALYTAKISPHRKVIDTSEAETFDLCAAIKDVMERSYAAKGNTVMTYKDVSGEVGTFASQLKVYGKKHDPEGRTVVSEETADGRTSWWVPEVQK